MLTSRAWGHEGGNDIAAEFRNPGVPSSPLTVSMVGNELVVLLGTNASGQLSSTAAQVVDAINANAQASQKLVANQFTRLSNATRRSWRAAASSSRARGCSCPTSSPRRRTRTSSAGRSSTP